MSRASISICTFEEIGKDDIDRAGGKGANLGELSRAGLPVPPGFVITTAAYDEFVAAAGFRDEIVRLAAAPSADDPTAMEAASDQIRARFMDAPIPDDLAAEIRAAYDDLAQPDGEAVAVRSSATAEDLSGASFAGQQDTYLNVRDAPAVLDAVKRCWASLWTARAMDYRRRQGIAPESVSLAVVVQRMVPADAAGILFTANPVTGQRQQTVINASWGLGEAIVGGRVTPDTVVVDTASGRVLSRETADKRVMTVPIGDGTAEQAVPEAQRREPVLDDATAAELARLGARIEALFGVPQDVEWARAAGQLAILQARPITALPEPAAAPPTEWPVPDPNSLYARASIVELLPDPLSPLFASMSMPIVTRATRNIMELGFGQGSELGEWIELTTINGYAYYGYRLTPRAMWQLTWALLTQWRSLSRILGPSRWREVTRPRYASAVAAWEARQLTEVSAVDLLEGARELLTRGAEYYTSVQQIIPVAATSEILFARAYDRLAKRPGDPAAPLFLLGFDSTPIQADRSLYDLAAWAREQPALAAALLRQPASRARELLADPPPAEVEERIWREWQERFRAHLDRYGRMIYDLDFAKPVPADDPAPSFDTFKLYLRGEGRDPHARQREAAATRERITADLFGRLDPARRTLLRRLLTWAQRNAPIREDALADLGLGWPMLRRMLLELGRRLAAARAINAADDVFWLEDDELRAAARALDAGTDVGDLTETVRRRRVEWRGRKLASPPLLLPRGQRFFGVDLEPWMPARMDDQAGDTIRGIGTSPGRVTAPARVLRGPEDFGLMRPGEVLVASITTPAWTPLFAMAAAVITDIGGPLSHGSIVAREYGIPAVMGTGVATRRIQSGQTLRVDGDAGTVTLLGETGVAEDLETPPMPDARRRIGARPLALGAFALGLGIGAAARVWRRRSR